MADRIVPFGQVRAAVVGEHLAVQADVLDAKPTRISSPAGSSHVALMAAPGQGRQIRRVLLLPQTGERPATVQVDGGERPAMAQVDGGERPAMAQVDSGDVSISRPIVIRSQPIEGGYRLLALVPLDLLGLPADTREFLLEVEVAAYRTAADRLRQGHLADAPLPRTETQGYCEVSVE